MKLFDYSCPSCGHAEEDKMVDKWDDDVICPICDHKMDKMFSGVNIQRDKLGNDHRIDPNVIGGGDVRFGNRPKRS